MKLSTRAFCYFHDGSRIRPTGISSSLWLAHILSFSWGGDAGDAIWGDQAYTDMTTGWTLQLARSQRDVDFPDFSNAETVYLASVPFSVITLV